MQPSPRDSSGSESKPEAKDANTSSAAPQKRSSKKIRKHRNIVLPKPAAVPVKGSFADIMARAKEIQNSKLGQPITIVNAPFKSEKTRAKERAKEVSMSRSGSEEPERKRKLMAAAAKTKPAATGKSALAGVKASPDGKKAAASAPASSYKGTRRPTTTAVPQSTYKGTAAATRLKPLPKPAESSRPGASSSSKRPNPASAAATASRRRRSDTPESYASGADSSDMEAGMTDIDAEEAEAERVARAEDLAAQREEEAHRRLKEERKRAAIAVRK
jgi:hypothetical protein